MTIPEGRFNKLETRVNDVAERLAKVEGASQVSTGSQNTILITILSIFGLAVLAYLGWIGVQVVDHGQKLAAIYELLAPEMLKQAANNPENPLVIKQVTNVLYTAQRKKEKIDPQILSESGGKFVEASTNPDAWRAAIAFLDYRSFLNSYLAPATSDFSPYPDSIKWLFEVPFAFQKEEAVHGAVSVGKHVPVGTAAVMERIEHPLNVGASVGYEFLLVDGLSLRLDGFKLKNVIFRNSKIIYDGGPVDMENIYFVNCTFTTIARKPAGESFAKAVLAPNPGTTFKTT